MRWYRNRRRHPPQVIQIHKYETSCSGHILVINVTTLCALNGMLSHDAFAADVRWLRHFGLEKLLDVLCIAHSSAKNEA
jgi:hypothetical protein